MENASQLGCIEHGRNERRDTDLRFATILGGIIETASYRSIHIIEGHIQSNMLKQKLCVGTVCAAQMSVQGRLKIRR